MKQQQGEVVEGVKWRQGGRSGTGFSGQSRRRSGSEGEVVRTLAGSGGEAAGVSK